MKPAGPALALLLAGCTTPAAVADCKNRLEAKGYVRQ
jgi:hypothetical protein